MKKIFFFIFVIFFIFSCKRYEDDPYFSLIPKKILIKKKWNMEFVENLKTGKRSYFPYTKWKIEFKDGDKYNSEEPFLQLNDSLSDWIILKRNGRWVFVGETKLQLSYKKDETNIYIRYEISRLTRKELWIKNEDTKFFYK